MNVSLLSPAILPRLGTFEARIDIPEAVGVTWHWPYDPAPPPAAPPLDLTLGGSCLALFVAPDGRHQSRDAFPYQDYDADGVPVGDEHLRVRHAPDMEGEWSVTFHAQWKGAEPVKSDPFTFTVSPSAARGHLRVSPTDPRYFEYEDGTPLYPGVGANGLHPDLAAGMPLQREIGYRRTTGWPWLNGAAVAVVPPGGPYLRSAHLNGRTDGEGALGASTRPETYTISSAGTAGKRVCIMALVKAENVTGPIDATGDHYGPGNYGVVIENIQWWVAASNLECTPFDPASPDAPAPDALWQAVGIVRDSAALSRNGWLWLRRYGTLRADPGVSLGEYENVGLINCTGDLYVARMSARTVETDGTLGPERYNAPCVDTYRLPDQLTAWRYDQKLQQAADAGICLYLTLFDHEDYVWQGIARDGSQSSFGPGNVYTSPPFDADSPQRWLQRARIRDACSRYGWSPNVLGFEFASECDPSEAAAKVGANHCADTVHQITQAAGARKLVSVSFWDMGASEWFGSADCRLDFADLHGYAKERGDPSRFAADLPAKVPASATFGKPILLGEFGFRAPGDTQDRQDPALTGQAALETYHAIIWSHVAAPGQYSLDWWEEPETVEAQRTSGAALQQFWRGIPLTNGRYKDAAAVCSAGVSAVGQKDVDGGALHLWARVEDGAVSPAVAVTMPDRDYACRLYDTHRPGVVIETRTVAAVKETLVIRLDGVSGDVGIRVEEKVMPTVDDALGQVNDALKALADALHTGATGATQQQVDDIKQSVAQFGAVAASAQQSASAAQDEAKAAQAQAAQNAAAIAAQARVQAALLDALKHLPDALTPVPAPAGSGQAQP